MRFIRRALAGLGGVRHARSEGSVLLAIGNACDSVRFGSFEDEALALRCNALVKRGLDKGAISYEDYRSWRKKNSLVFTSVVDRDGSLIGFFDVFPIEAVCAEALLAGRLNERAISLDDIIPRHELARVVYLHIATIMVDPGQRSFTPMVAKEALLMQFKGFIEEHYDPLERKVFTAYAQTPAGEALLRRAGFSAAVLPAKGGRGAALYVLRPGGNQDAFLRFARAQRCIGAERSGSVLPLLDGRIASIECELRRIIGVSLHNDFTRVPGNVVQKVRDRVETAMRKDALIDATRLSVLSEWLEFADLRELQDIVLNKLLWPCFQAVFHSKSTTELRFAQLAELRNCLRHSRRVNLVVEKEGEAAILWFEAMQNRG